MRRIARHTEKHCVKIPHAEDHKDEKNQLSLKVYVEHHYGQPYRAVR